MLAATTSGLLPLKPTCKILLLLYCFWILEPLRHLTLEPEDFLLVASGVLSLEPGFLSIKQLIFHICKLRTELLMNPTFGLSTVLSEPERKKSSVPSDFKELLHDHYFFHGRYFVSEERKHIQSTGMFTQ